MTGVPVRDTKFATWIDPDAWMERMEGPRWRAVLKDEAALVEKVVSKTEVKQRIGRFRVAYTAAQDKQESIKLDCGPAKVTWSSSFIKGWHFAASPYTHDARDLTYHDEMIWTTRDKGDGAEDFQLECWTSACTTKPLWHTKHSVGPDVAWHEKRLYYLGVKNKLIYHELWSCDPATGADKKLIYSEKNPEVNLALDKQPDGRLLLIRDNSQDTESFEIHGDAIGRKPVGRYAVPNSWILPLSGQYGIDFVWPRLGYLITKQHGKRTLWKCGSRASPVKIHELVAGDFLVNPFQAFAGVSPTQVCITAPNIYNTMYLLHGAKLHLVQPTKPTGLVTKRFSGQSHDGTTVYGVVTYARGTRPSRLLVIGYGAYGLPSAVGSVAYRWAPLVENGWAIVHTFLRGGGDHTEAWAKAGRREGRTKTLEDFKGLIVAAQLALNIPSKHTVIYGRSAGGLLVGGSLSNYPDGDLMGAVYAEVPYVDELRTTTNDELPLTVLEYNEFGNPGARLNDFISVGRLSPADSATVTASPEVLVLTRTAENDSQVFAYESVKWIRRLRAAAPKGAPKLCIVEAGQGHFTPPDATVVQWATDCAILDAWVHGDLN